MEPSPSRRSAADVVRFYLGIFLYAGAFFGVFWGAWMALVIWIPRGWDPLRMVQWSVLAGLAFGAAMSLTIGTLALYATRGRGAAALRVHQQRRLELRGARDDVVRRVAAALAALPRAGRAEVDAAAGTAEVRIGWSWRSFGEVVTARVVPIDAENHEVHVASRPRVRLTWVDYGANAANVEAIVAALAFT